jgi:hypothetical protein
MSKRQGQLKYTQRGFQQDAEEAMKGDVMRALIELITNVDDAYDGKGNGQIEIVFNKSAEPYKGVFIVRDKAGGLNGTRMEEAFTNLGDKNQKAVAEMGTRGLFGRGAKDIAALGRARFLSIHKGKFSSLEINSRGEYQMDFLDDEPTEEAYTDTNLAKGESGLTAELYVHARHRIPSASEMIEKLQANVQLRELINRNEVTYYDERTKVVKRLEGLAPSGEIVLDLDIQVAKYKLPVHLTVYRLPAKEVGPLNGYSRHGIVIGGRGATYENSFLHLSGKEGIGWFCGRLDAPEIHDLSRAVDEEGGQNELNPTRVISRSRDGIVREHPYWTQLCAAVEPHLKPILEAIADEEGAQRREGDKLRNRFNALSNTLANKLQELLDASDSGEIPTETGEDDSYQDLTIIPPRRICKKNEVISLTVRAPEGMDLAPLQINLTSGTNVVEILELPDPNGWVKHERLPVVSNTVRIKALNVGSTSLIATRNEVSAFCEITVIDFDTPEEVIPEGLIFDPETVSVAPEKRKVMILRAPIEFAGEKAHITVNNDLLEVQKVATLKPNGAGTACEARVVAIAGKSEGNATVTAIVGSATANATVKITEAGHKRNPKLDFELSGRDNPSQRVTASIEDGKLMIRLYGKHRSLKNIFGAWTVSGFENENTPEASATICETLAQQLASYVVEREAEMHPERFSDAAMYFARQQQLLPHFVIALQAGLVNR